MTVANLRHDTEAYFMKLTYPYISQAREGVTGRQCVHAHVAISRQTLFDCIFQPHYHVQSAEHIASVKSMTLMHSQQCMHMSVIYSNSHVAGCDMCLIPIPHESGHETIYLLIIRGS